MAQAAGSLDTNKPGDSSNREGAPASSRGLQFVTLGIGDDTAGDTHLNLRLREEGKQKTEGEDATAKLELQSLKGALPSGRSSQRAVISGDGVPDTETTAGEPSKQQGFLRRNKWKISIAGAILGGGGIGIVGLFSLILPLKVTSIVTNLDNVFQAAPTAALQKAEDNLFNDYLAKYVLPGIKTNRCRSTVEITCVSGIDTHNPVLRLYTTWRHNHIETKLAKDYGIVFGRDEHGKLYMSLHGEQRLDNAVLQKVMDGDASIFDEGVGAETSLSDARAALRAAFHDTSLWDRVFFRFQVGKLLEEKYGITRCVIACDFFDKFTATAADKKSAALAAFVRRFLSLFSKEYAIMFQCFMVPNKAFCRESLQKIQNLQPGETLDSASLTPFERNLQQDMVAYAADPANDLTDLAAAVQNASDISKQGFLEVIVDKTLSSIFGDAAGQVGVRAISPAGWLLFGSWVISNADTLGPNLRLMSYAVNEAAAAKLYAMYSSVSSEMKSGHVDSQELGSFVQSLSTNMDGSSSDQVDATSTPLYNALIGGGTVSNSSNYKCNDGNSVPSGQLLCPEEKLDRGNDIADAITQGVNTIPGLTGLAHVINQVNDLIGDLTSGAFTLACHGADLVPPGSSCSNSLKTAGQYVGQFANWFINVLIPSPFSTHMSGGRTFDMMAAGADVTANKVCQVELGCARLSNQQIADIRNQVRVQQHAAFDSQPLFARIFSTTSPYSLVSRMAVAMPTTLPGFFADVTSVAANPFHTLATSIGSMFAHSPVFAAQAPINDPFGVVQYGYTANQIPADPSAYWDQHCKGNFGVDWMNSLPQDPHTGEPLATTPEPCLLIQSAVQSGGTVFDPSFAPAGSLNPDPIAQ